MKRFLLAVTWLSFAIFGLAVPSRATAEDDLLIADFEGDSYGDWKVEGAGNHEGKTCMNLLVDGKIVRSAIGPALKNDQGPEERPRPGSDGLDQLGRPGTEGQAGDAADRAQRGNEPIELRIFIDRSVVEVFANGRQYLALRVYPGREDSLGVALRAVGNDATLKSLDAWQMKSIYQ